MWDALEDQGHRLSAVGGSDDHSAGVGAGVIGSPIGSPAALVLANELSETAIIEAVRHQHTMIQLRGPDDPFVDVKLEKRDGSLADIGDDIDGISDVAISVRVTGASGMFVEIWRNGAKIDQLPVTSDDFTGVAHDVPGAGDHRYRVELTDTGAKRVVVTSHFYVHAIDGKGGGCNAGGGGSPMALALAALGLLLRKRRQR
jgi:uncharacterized protein (TIGR03382 family)